MTEVSNKLCTANNFEDSKSKQLFQKVFTDVGRILKCSLVC